MKRRNNRKLLIGSYFSMEATEGLARLVSPLLRSQSVSIRQFTSVLKKAAVQFEASRFANSKGNNARIAFSTGLTRGEVAQLRRQGIAAPESNVRALLGAWRCQASFLDKRGSPADLPIYGGRKSFERLAKRFGKGLPVRAILDELLDRGAIALLPEQTVRLNDDFPGPECEFWARFALQLESQVEDASATRALKGSTNPPRTHFKRRSTQKRTNP